MVAATSPTIAMEAERPKKGGPKTLAHMEIHPALKGGHIVRHVYAGYKHDATEHHFKEGEEERMAAHISRHLGLKPVKAERSLHEDERDIDTESQGRRGYRTKGSKGTPSTFFRGSRDVDTPSR